MRYFFSAASTSLIGAAARAVASKFAKKKTEKKVRNLMEDDDVKTTGKKFRNLMEDAAERKTSEEAGEGLKRKAMGAASVGLAAPITYMATKEVPEAIEEPRAKRSSEAERQKKIEELRAKRSSEAELKKAKGGIVKSSASKRADGIAQRGKTRGRMV